MASDFQAARLQRTTAALNPYLEWHESTMDPTRLQLVEARQFQALELARLSNVPAYLVGAPTGTGMTYQNATQARSDLIDFGAMPYLQCIEQTLSGDNVCPRNSFVRFDLNAWLRNPTVPNNNATPNDAQIALNPNASPTPNGGPA
jgi:phage portal protein BeeE